MRYASLRCARSMLFIRLIGDVRGPVDWRWRLRTTDIVLYACRCMYTHGRLARPSDEATLRTHAAVGAARLRPERPPTFRGGKRSKGNERDYDDAACDYDDAACDHDGSGDSGCEPIRRAAAQPDRRTHQEKELQKEKHFRRELPFWLDTQRHLSPRLASHRQAQSSAILAQVQLLISEYAEEPVLAACCCGGEGHALLTERRSVQYRGLQGWGMLQVPKFACTACAREQEMPACAGGCVASSPLTGGIWFDQMLLNLHAQLTPLGVSATSLAQALDGAARSFRSMECGVLYPPILDDRPLGWAAAAQRVVMRRMEDASLLVADVKLHTGLYGFCPVCCEVADAPPCSCRGTANCSSTPRSGPLPEAEAAVSDSEDAPADLGGLDNSTRSSSAAAASAAAGPAATGSGRQEGGAAGTFAGVGSTADVRPEVAAHSPDICSYCAGVNSAACQAPVGERRPRLINPDAVVKGGHFQSRGTSITAAHEDGRLEPLNSDFIGGPGSAEIMLPQFLHPRRGVPSGEGDVACTAHLSCARPVGAGNSTVKDVECFAGAVCGCGVPVKGMFLSCPRPECFAIYDA